MGRELCPGKGSPSREGNFKKRGFQTPGNTLPAESVASLGNTEGNITVRKNRYMYRNDICVCITESLCCPPETITTLLINYAPI